MPHVSLLSPLPGLPWYLLPIWPLIFWRIQRLRTWFRENGHPGAQMLWGVMKSGRVILIRASDSLTGLPSYTFRSPVSDRLRLACEDGPLPCSRRIPGPQTVLCGLAARDPDVCQKYGLCAVIPDT